MERYSKIISTCCYIKDGGKILFLHRAKREGLNNKKFYRGLGGKAEQGESPIECVKREVREEAGIEINPVWKGILTISKPLENDWEAHVFVAEGFEGNLMLESPEGELVWIDMAEAHNLEMPEGDKKLFHLLFKHGNFHAHAKYDNYKNLVDLKVEEI